MMGNKNPVPDIVFDLLRHGQCEGGEIFRGSTDVTLTPEGYDNMQQAVESTSHSWQGVISSPMRRCIHFAQDTAKSLSIPVQTEQDLRETCFGDWEGKLISDIWNNDQATAQKWFEDPSKTHPNGGEPLANFTQRIESAIQKLAEQHSGKHLLVVTHGGVIRVLLAIAQSLPWTQLAQLKVPYAHLSTLGWNQEQGLFLADEYQSMKASQ